MSALIECRAVSCSLAKKPVLRGVKFQIESNEAVALLGTSGSGKSTLLRLIAGLLAPDSGSITVSGKVAAQDGQLLVPARCRQVAMVFQDLALWPNLTVAGNVAFGLSGLRLPRCERRGRTAQALQLCSISDLAARHPGTLSGGQQQRVALARALAMQPRALLLDEPFGGLDLLTKKALIEELSQLRMRLGFAILLVTHDPAEVEALCESVAVLEDGRLVEHGSLTEVISHPRSLLARALADSVA